jgi:hypothetical protein
MAEAWASFSRFASPSPVSLIEIHLPIRNFKGDCRHLAAEEDDAAPADMRKSNISTAAIAVQDIRIFRSPSPATAPSSRSPRTTAPRLRACRCRSGRRAAAPRRRTGARWSRPRSRSAWTRCCAGGPAPLTCSAISAWCTSPASAAGVIGPIGADWSKALPMHQGRPCFFMSFCRSRRVMSRPTA